MSFWDTLFDYIGVGVVTTDWASLRPQREATVKQSGEWVGLLDKDWNLLCEIGDWESAEWPALLAEVGSMSMTLPGELESGVRNPVCDLLLQRGSADVDGLFHDALTVVVERAGRTGEPNERRFYRILDIVPGGGRDHPTTVTITGLCGVEYLKHLPLWADPSNHSNVVQAQFEDKQSGSAEMVCRKLVGRNLFGYQQIGMIARFADWKIDSTTMTETYTDPNQWTDFNPRLNNVVCSPKPSGLPSEHCVVNARWDNAYDLLKPTWDAAGIKPVVSLWLPGDDQPFPEYATLTIPCVIIDFKPCSTVSGARNSIDQGIRSFRRSIKDDTFTSTIEFADVDVATHDGRPPWVVFDLQDAPRLTIRKSTDSHFVVGGKAPKIVNTVVKSGIKAFGAAIVSMIPGVGPPVAEVIKGGFDIVGEMSADRFLALNQYTDQDRKDRHGRSRYISLAKKGEANSLESLQKAWQAKSETNGGLSIEFSLDDPYPYVPNRDFDIGDIVGVTAWGEIWSAYVSELTWTSEAGQPLGWKVRLGDLRQMQDPDALFAQNKEAVASTLQRLTATVN